MTAIVLVLSCAILAEGASVRLNVVMPRGKNSIGEGDIFWITYSLNNMSGNVSRPASAGGCTVMYFDQTGSSSSYSSVNGNVTQSSTIEYTLTLRAKKQGKYTFGPVSIGGVTSNTVSYTIGAPGASSGQHGNTASPNLSASSQQQNGGPKFIGKGDGRLFLRANVSKTTAFEQEALVYTVKLYTSYDGIRFVGAAAAPKFEGFTVEESKEVSQSLTFETYNGRSYATAVIARYIIFPQMTGSLKVIGNTYTVSVDEREYYSDPIYGNMSVSRPIQLNVTPNDLVVSVRPLPTPRPDNFCGGVGQFSIKSELKSGSLKTNEPFSIVYSVSGRGNLKYIKLPQLNTVYPREFEVFSPNIDTKTTVDASNVGGIVYFDYSIVPQKEGDFKIPALELVYFNPSSGRYEKAVARGYDVTVGKGSVSRGDASRMRKINTELIPFGKLSHSNELITDTWLYWLWYIIPTLCLGGGLLLYRAYAIANADVEQVRRRKATSMARKRLAKARAAMKNNNSDLFYQELLNAIWQWLSDKLAIPVSDLNRNNVEQQLENAGADKEKMSRLISLVDKCEYARYAPKSEPVDMTHDYSEAEDLIFSISDSIDKKNKK